MLLTREHIEQAMQLDVDDIAGAFQLTEFYEDAAYLSSVSFIGMNEISQFVYKVEWHTLPGTTEPEHVYVSLRYNKEIGGIDYYVDY